MRNKSRRQPSADSKNPVIPGPISNFPITLEREWVTLYLPITNDPFGEESSQRGREDRVESHFWLEARDR